MKMVYRKQGRMERNRAARLLVFPAFCRGHKKPFPAEIGRKGLFKKKERLVHAAQVGTVFRLYGNLFAGLDEQGNLHN